MRRIEIDIARSIAIIGMVIYHTAYDLRIFYRWDIPIFSGHWKILQVFIASLFLLIVGISFALSGKNGRSTIKRLLRRTYIIGGSAMLVTLATFVADSETYVRFGILHLIAISTLLLPVFSPLKERAAFPGLILLFLGPILASMRVKTSLLLPFGMMPNGFQTVDYYPLIPWFGVVLIGYSIGYFLYVRCKIVIGKDLQRTPLLRILAWPGRNALLLYLIHQPVLLGMLWVVSRWW